jgi:cyclohexadieny/prephenate dehydrogenase
MSKPLFDTLAIIGLGLIGSSIARAARAKGAARQIVATARSPKTRHRVIELGLANKVVETNAEAAEGADLVIVCIPVGVCGTVAKEIGPHLQAGAVVSDVGSVKGSIVRDMAPHLPKTVHFVPAHPVAGTEHSGPDAGFAELFENRWCILTPPEGTDPEAVDKLAAVWRLLGAKVEIMTPEHHDIVLAITSHIPHLIAYNIVGTAADVEEVTQSEVIKFSAGGFRDFTRIRSCDVARRVSQQQGGGAGDARPLLRGSRRPPAHDPLGRRRGARSAVHPHPRHPPLHHRGRPGHRGGGFRPPPRP